ncbi:SGNH/GDSL hydrolase family protein [Mycobacterium sp. 852002-51057_SCH5723018]|uniref:SGNH/GDSL hydrolase family protein n=1 Tax=Mycobacterium sp. 852002-51057_SCH5723018 TaxID=1834094 RepID=UPI0008003016|nr:SGNH/GDSL hydrolase family protein [Mycobacterium sp. 852002-51057_SCH5723018]OBG26723.1 hypothetical protein A5764_04765 [Mycobacterium sp. 852002-51057_SCH5723018]
MSNTLWVAHRATLLIVIAVLASTVAGLAYFELGSGTNRSNDQSGSRENNRSISAMFEYKPTLLVVGDSYAGGVDARVVTYPHLVADNMGWGLALDVQGGTGFVHGLNSVSPPRVPFIDRVDHDAANYYVDYVLIDGGRNDLDEPPERVLAAADQYVKKVHSQWPSAKIVIICPSYASSLVAPSYSAVAQGLRSTAESVGAYVIDPVAQGWYRDIDVKQLLWRDGVHLNDDGETYYAAKVVENLKQMFDQAPKLLVIGDSYAGGVGDPQIVTYPRVIADKLGWSLVLDARGTGYVHGVDNSSSRRVPFIDGLDRDAATYRPDYILIDGGRTDLDEPPDRVVAAADQYIRKVRLDWPHAKIIVMIPSFATPEVPPNYPALAQGLSRTAESVGAYVIDPVAQHWYRDVDVKPLLWRDNVQLSSHGQTYYATKVIDNLKRMGLLS